MLNKLYLYATDYNKMTKTEQQQKDTVLAVWKDFQQEMEEVSGNNLEDTVLEKIKNLVANILNKLPYIRGLAKELSYYKYYNRVLPGHYHSAIPSQEEIDQHYAQFSDNIKGIDFDFTNQTNILESFLPFYKECPWDFKNDGNNSNFRYKNKGSYYRYSDAIFLYTMIRAFNPSNIIEVGSGFSSAIMLDTKDLFFKDKKIQLTFIEPNPETRLDKLISQADRKTCKIHVKKVQDVSLETYKALEKNDILFIDSSHVSKAGSDLNYILFEVLPILKKGVIIHFHDVFFPFEYPKDWLDKKRFYWNECYLLRAFLMNNIEFKILFFNSAAHKFQQDYLTQNMPDVLIDHEHCGAIWIQKTA